MTFLNTKVYLGDSREVLKQFPDGSFNLIFTSPPYADARKRHYEGVTPDKDPEFFLSFHEQLWRVLADDGSFVLNIKDKVVDGVRDRYVWKTILALIELGWRCVDDYLWVKPNAMPGFWPNRLRDEWEYCFHLTKNREFAMYQDAVRRPMKNWAEKRLAKLNGKSAERHDSENDSGFGRDLRNWLGKQEALPGNVVNVALVGKNMGHPAAFPVGLPEFFIKLFTKEDDQVLDPFGGSGSTAVACENLKRNVVLIEKKQEYFEATITRLGKVMPRGRERHYYSSVDEQTCEIIPSATLFDTLPSVDALKAESESKKATQYKRRSVKRKD